MHSTGSFLLTVIERIRAYLDEATLDAKYTNDYLVRHVICPEMVNVLSRLSLNFGNPVRVRHSITLDKETEHYTLPPNIGEIYRVAIMDDKGRVNQEWVPENEFHPRGPGWQIQGNLLSFRPLPTVDETVEIHYIPNGDFSPHYSNSAGQYGAIDSTNKIFTFPASPDLGAIDNREQAYAGAMLRVWDNNVLEERVIASYDALNRKATVRVAFTSAITASSSDLQYEVAPLGMQSLYQTIACAGAVNLGTCRNITQKQMQFLMLQYKTAMKSAADNFTSIQARIPKGYDKKTADNRGMLLLGD